MLNTSIPSMSFCKRYHAISLLMANDPDLLDYFFSEDRNTLSISAESLFRESFALPQQERTLVQIALSIWTETTVVQFADIYILLNEVRHEGLLLALEFLTISKPGRCVCWLCWRFLLSPPQEVKDSTSIQYLESDVQF